MDILIATAGGGILGALLREISEALKNIQRAIEDIAVNGIRIKRR
jgi:hypothetical protein